MLLNLFKSVKYRKTFTAVLKILLRFGSPVWRWIWRQDGLSTYTTRDFYFLVPFNLSWLVGSPWVLINQKNLLRELSWVILLSGLMYPWKFPRGTEFHLGKNGHTKSRFPVGNSHLPVDKMGNLAAPILGRLKRICYGQRLTFLVSCAL